MNTESRTEKITANTVTAGILRETERRDLLQSTARGMGTLMNILRSCQPGHRSAVLARMLSTTIDVAALAPQDDEVTERNRGNKNG